MREIGVWLEWVQAAAKATGYDWRVIVSAQSDRGATNGHRSEIALRLATEWGQALSRREIVHRWADVQLANAHDWRGMIDADVSRMVRELDAAIAVYPEP